jgi:hypothetical protein
MGALLRKLVHLSRSEWADLARAELALLQALWLVKTRPTGQLVSEAQTSESDTKEINAQVSPRAFALGLAIERAAEYGPIRPKCLVRAVALDRLLHSSGLEGSEVKVGVVHGDGRFAAHAWVEYRGAVLGDREWRVRQFSELSRVEVSS